MRKTEKSKLIETTEETTAYYQERFKKKPSPFFENQMKSAELANAIIREACEIDNLTPFIIKNALKMTEEIVETVIINDVLL